MRKHRSPDRGVEKEGEGQAGTLLVAGEASLPLPGDNLHSRPSTSLLSYTWRVLDTHTQNKATHPRNVGGEHTSIPWAFSKIFVSPGGVATWERRREGKETAKGMKERASEGPSYLLNGPGPVQKRDKERASPAGGRGGGVPEQPDLSPNACGGGTPRSLRCGTQ